MRVSRPAAATTVTLALATAIHLDWHLARPAIHHLSLGLSWHWVVAIPTFGLVGWYVGRAWKGRLLAGSLGIVGGAIVLGGVVEPAWEYFLGGATAEWAFGAVRNTALVAFVGTGLVSYLVGVTLARRRWTE